MNQNTSSWLHGLIAALIGGGASAVTVGVTAPAIAPESFNLSSQLGHTAELAFGLFLVNGVMSAMAYLKQSPLPAQSIQVTETVTKTATLDVTKSSDEPVTKTENPQ